MRSPDLHASDSFVSTETLVDDAAAAGAGALAMGTPMFVGIGAAALALFVLVALVLWRLRKSNEIAGPIQEDPFEAMTEFTWEAQVDNVFTDAGTYQNPDDNLGWDASHFAQALNTHDDDPFTQFE